MTTILALGHRSGVGEDTLASILVEEHGFVRLAFADALKAVLGVMRPHLDRQVADAITELGIEEAKRSPVPVRAVLIDLENAVRAHVSPDAWVLAVTRKIDEAPDGRFVITDLRLPNEVRTLRDRGAYLIRVDRKAAQVSDDLSDRALEGFDQWDAIVDNNGGIEDLRVWAAKIVTATTRTGRPVALTSGCAEKIASMRDLAGVALSSGDSRGAGADPRSERCALQPVVPA